MHVSKPVPDRDLSVSAQVSVSIHACTLEEKKYFEADNFEWLVKHYKNSIFTKIIYFL